MEKRAGPAGASQRSSVADKAAVVQKPATEAAKPSAVETSKPAVAETSKPAAEPTVTAPAGPPATAPTSASVVTSTATGGALPGHGEAPERAGLDAPERARSEEANGFEPSRVPWSCSPS